MAVEVQSVNYDNLGRDLEMQELESPGGVANVQVYGQLLCVYLLQNDVCNAKFLWKRIPASLKSIGFVLAISAGPDVMPPSVAFHLSLHCLLRPSTHRLVTDIQANSELGLIWTVGQKMWLRDFPGTYEALKKDWTDTYKPIMAAVLEATRERAFDLVGQAFSSINADDFAAYVGLPVNEAIQAAQTRGWQADPHTRLVTPKKPVPPIDPPLPNEQHLAVLTDYVSFLES